MPEKLDAKRAESLAQMVFLKVDEVPPVEVGPGCVRRDLPSNPGVRVWIVEMAADSQWPYVDVHETGEEFYVLDGELIEGQERFEAGTYVLFQPGTRHQPRTEKGVRLLGFNLTAGARHEEGGD